VYTLEKPVSGRTIPVAISTADFKTGKAIIIVIRAAIRLINAVTVVIRAAT